MMRQSHGKVRISTVAVLGAAAVAMLACAGCFGTAAPAAHVPATYESPAWMRADEKAENDAIAAAKQAAADVWNVCTPALHRSIDDCAKVCDLFDAGSENTKKEAREKLDRQLKKALDLATAPRAPTYQEVMDRLSPLCVQEHLKECAVVEISQSKTLDESAKGEPILRFLAQIDPACDAAVRFAGQKRQAMESAFAQTERDAAARTHTECVNAGGIIDCANTF